jgi:hypothetical protein
MHSDSRKRRLYLARLSAVGDVVYTKLNVEK